MVKMEIQDHTIRMKTEIPILPVVKTEDMTQPVGRDPNGRLWTLPGGGGGGSAWPELPFILPEDERKVLTVRNGLPVWEALPEYNGAYSVTPSPEDVRVLATAQKYMDADLRVEKIPFFEVSNQDGTTVYIGSEV